jgi:hypothetical protein
VNLAMRDYVERFRRIEALARSREQANSWDDEGWLATRHPTSNLGWRSQPERCPACRTRKRKVS